MEDQPKPRLPTLEEVAAVTTAEQAAMMFGTTMQRYMMAKAQHLMRNRAEPMNVYTQADAELMINMRIHLDALMHKADAVLDELIAENQPRDVRVTLRLVKKLHDEMQALPTITIAGADGKPLRGP